MITSKSHFWKSSVISRVMSPSFLGFVQRATALGRTAGSNDTIYHNICMMTTHLGTWVNTGIIHLYCRSCFCGTDDEHASWMMSIYHDCWAWIRIDMIDMVEDGSRLKWLVRLQRHGWITHDAVSSTSWCLRAEAAMYIHWLSFGATTTHHHTSSLAVYNDTGG